ncbi:MAG: YebC/PmpR family DNA-binding transcriptional regulator, partial [Terriglobales bacterium]
RDDGGSWEVLTPPDAYDAVLAAVKAKKLEPENAEVAMVPQNYIKLDGKEAEQMLKLLDAIDDSDDVTHVYSNFDMDEPQLATA